MITRRARQTQTPGGLSLPERATLAQLDRGGPASSADMARAAQITPQAMGTTLTALEERGFVDRRRDPADGRRIIMSLTESGREMLRHKRDALSRQLAKALGEQFTAGELRALRAAAPLLERLGESI
ncbi:MarR family winged helix-turn-helix transcriptional regulator [Nocardia sp. NPDC051570]|uniref:MarR family winged helix-turn-helix transcriptional regulator n=1 Tax=Nocardia sp. NPDC051570 TaxID=3364324 RepID=UPI0037A54B7F